MYWRDAGGFFLRLASARSGVEMAVPLEGGPTPGALWGWYVRLGTEEVQPISAAGSISSS